MTSSVSTKPLSFGLDRDCFVGEKRFELETELIFSKHWICVARIEDFGNGQPTGEPDSDVFLTVSIAADNLIVVRKKAGGFRAFHNVCRHRGTRLIDEPSGVLKNSCIVCPYHAWTYDLSGCLIGAPNMMDLESFKRADFGLHRIGCVNWCGFIMVHLNQTDEQFEEAFAPVLNRFQAWEMHKLRLGHTLEYNVDANWKVLFQNYNECYHCPTVHPSLNRLTPYRSATNDLTDGAILGGPMQLADGFETVSSDGKKIAAPFSGLNEVQKHSVYYYTIFPTMFISAHPDYVMVHLIERVTNDSSKVKCHFLVAKDTSNDDLARAVTQWDAVNREDWQVCELTQKGVESSVYVPGPYSSLETMLIAFDRHYRQVIDSQST